MSVGISLKIMEHYFQRNSNRNLKPFDQVFQYSKKRNYPFFNSFLYLFLELSGEIEVRLDILAPDVMLSDLNQTFKIKYEELTVQETIGKGGKNCEKKFNSY